MGAMRDTRVRRSKGSQERGRRKGFKCPWVGAADLKREVPEPGLRLL